MPDTKEFTAGISSMNFDMHIPNNPNLLRDLENLSNFLYFYFYNLIVDCSIRTDPKAMIDVGKPLVSAREMSVNSVVAQSFAINVSMDILF